MFAQSVGLLPSGMFVRMLEAAKRIPEQFQSLASTLFTAMKSSGLVGFEKIEWFNGGLFDSDDALPLTAYEIALCLRAAARGWSEIDPSTSERCSCAVSTSRSDPRPVPSTRTVLETARETVQDALASATSYPELADEVRSSRAIRRAGPSSNYSPR